MAGASSLFAPQLSKVSSREHTWTYWWHYMMRCFYSESEEVSTAVRKRMWPSRLASQRDILFVALRRCVSL
jgi:hypothetical protein